MVAAVSSAGLRFFRHYRRPDSCALTGETAEHLRLKRGLLAAVRAVAGWRAEAEVPGQGWRADVLATGPDGRRIAFEVQVSRIDADEAQERTRRLAASGVEACWFMVRRNSLAAARGLAGLPRAAVMLSDDTETQVTAFAEAFDPAKPFAPENAGWRAVTVELPAFVAGVCRGSVRWVESRPLATGGAWTTRQHLAAAGEHAAWWDGILRRWGSGRPALIRERPEFPQPPPTDDARVRELMAWQKTVRRGWGRWGPPPP
jgi:competence protein CoiA